MQSSSGSYVKLSNTLYYGIHPQIVNPLGIPAIDHYVSLVEDHEVSEESSHLYHSFPIIDRKAPSLVYLKSIVKHVLSLEGVVYLFCKGGHGRSGTVAACIYGTTHKLSGKDAMAHINKE